MWPYCHTKIQLPNSIIKANMGAKRSLQMCQTGSYHLLQSSMGQQKAKTVNILYEFH